MVIPAFGQALRCLLRSDLAGDASCGAEEGGLGERGRRKNRSVQRRICPLSFHCCMQRPEQRVSGRASFSSSGSTSTFPPPGPPAPPLALPVGPGPRRSLGLHAPPAQRHAAPRNGLRRPARSGRGGAAHVSVSWTRGIVSQWKNQSNGRHHTPTTASNRPRRSCYVPSIPDSWRKTKNIGSAVPVQSLIA